MLTLYQGHEIMVSEGYAWPGTMVVASDSHSNHYGAVGCLGTPIVRTDAASIWVIITQTSIDSDANESQEYGQDLVAGTTDREGYILGHFTKRCDS